MVQGTSEQHVCVSVSDEISDISTTLTRLQSVCATLQQKFEQETFSLNDKINELEAEKRELVKTNKWLEHQNDALQDRIDRFKPELDNAVQAREISQKKLRRTRKVLKDVIGEYEEKFNAQPESLAQLWEPESGAEGAEEPTRSRTSSSGHASPHEDNHSAKYSKEASERSENKTSGAHGPAAREEVPKSSEDEQMFSAEEDASVLGSLPPDIVPEPKSYQIRRVDASGVSEEYDNWRVQFSNPPASSKVKAGPISWKDLENPSKFELDGTTISSLVNLTASTELELCIVMAKNYAFVRDPTFLEDKKGRASYLLDWGSKDGNQRVKRYISTSSKVCDSVFHTFVYLFDLKGQGRWYYIGAQKWQAVELDKIWNGMAEGSRGAVLDKLSQRTRGIVEKQAILNAMENEELEQICVRFVGEPYVDSSRAECSRMGYKAKEKK
ncbi:hypothetical protein D9758_012191 [Tetrapyrgos nigripes]|uniref:Uncharacterized protein n=1 Tax=Tetrapyrgos nigripes TaxID=182062 RepID=A0A8H5CFN3_9AGAR|nr:hypothetical protein D9758_012191 [Tetrapyrgos nigripes]